MSTIFRHIVCYTVFSIIIQIFTPIPPVQCSKIDISTKLDILRFFLRPRRGIIRRLRDMPGLQLLGLINDVVEPFVTFAELLMLIEEKKKHAEKIESHPIHVKDKNMYSGEKTLEVNHFTKPNEDIAHIDSPDHYPHQDQYDNMIPLGSDPLSDDIGYKPVLLSSHARHEPQDLTHDVHQISYDFGSEEDFHSFRDSPNSGKYEKTYVLYGKPKSSKRSKKSQMRDYIIDFH